MAYNIRYEDLPMQRHISEELEDLLLRLTHKLPDRRLGKNGAKEVK